MKKRTCKNGYTKKEQHFDALAAAQHAGVVSGDPDYWHLLGRADRNAKYERKRLTNARMSGIGARECARRVGARA